MIYRVTLETKKELGSDLLMITKKVYPYIRYKSAIKKYDSLENRDDLYRITVSKGDNYYKYKDVTRCLN